MDLDQVNQIIIKGTNINDKVAPISQITDNIYLGQGRTTGFADLLTAVGITHVVSIGKSPHQPVIDGPFYRYELRGALDIDTENLVVHFPSVFEFIRQALQDGGKLYVHCEMGMSRSATVLIAFLRADGYCETLQTCYDLVKSKRPWIAPNPGFIRQLRTFFDEPLGVGLGGLQSPKSPPPTTATAPTAAPML